VKRRHFLSTLMLAATAAAQPSSPVTANALAKTMSYRRVRPGDAGWPSSASWAKLGETVGGNLIKVRSLFQACQAEPHDASCVDAHKNIGNPYWIGDQPGGTENSGLLDGWTPAPSTYAIKARDANDVAAGIAFAVKHRLRLAVKGGGHSYLGTSNAPDSLLIWTRAMNEVALHEAFIAQGNDGRAPPVPAVSAGAGAVWMDLYHAVTTEGGRYVPGGSCTTVGVAGLVQSGGFNSFSKGFGTAAASLLETEIVTADGRVRVVNEYQDPELFWALKGGGGGTFGVVTRVTLRTHALPRFFGAAWGEVKARSDEAFARLIARFIAFYAETLFNQYWGEHVHFRSDNTLEIDMLSQGLTPEQALAAWQPFFEWIKSFPDDFTADALGASAWDARTWWDPDKRSSSYARDMRPGAPRHHAWGKGDQGEVGVFLHGYDSLWLPASLLQNDRQQALADALFVASRHQMVRLHIGNGLAGASPEVRAAVLQTAMNPAVVDAFTLVIIAEGEKPPAYPGYARSAIDLAAARRNARDIDLVAAELRKIAPHSGSYLSESSYFNRDWQAEYWGRNYARLRRIKSRYDADGLLIVHHGVGSEEWSADGLVHLT
jgi:FAD/FMN-containing dehydrogenase